MKKIVVLFVIFVMIMMIGYSYAIRNSTQLIFNVIDNEQNENFDLYVLLPKDYIQYAISYAGLYIKYDGANTLKENDIPGIEVNKENIQDELYEEDNIEYVQVLLDKQEDGSYKFDMLKNYTDLTIRFRIKNDKKDYIAHIDNFKTENGVCKIEYDYVNDILKQPDNTIVKKNVIVLIIILFIVIIIGIISYIKRGDRI